MASNLAIQSGAIILTVLVLGIILGYTGGIGLDLANTITDTNFSTKTVNFVNEAGDLGFNILKFNYLIAIGFVAFAVLALFMYRGGYMGGGGV